MAAKRGPKKKFKQEYIKHAYLLAVAGKIDKEIAEYFDISERLLNNWKNEYPEIMQSIKKGKDEFDTGNVENALLKRALGYEYKETIQSTDEKGKEVKKGAKVITKTALPDVGALCFWLKNRQQGRWRDKPNADTGEIVLKTISNIAEILSKRDPESLKILAKNFDYIINELQSKTD